MRERLQAVLLGSAGILTLAFGATVCTTFSGLEAEGGPSKDAGPDGPEGGSDVEQEVGPDAAAGQSYLSLAEAAKACTRIFDCPNLANSILWSMAVPVDDLNYSLCLHWLAGPISKERVGFALQSDVFACVAEATSCPEAAACLWIEILTPGDPRCADAGDGGQELCANDDKTVVRCAYNYALHCNSAYYAPGATCLAGINDWKGCGLGQNCSGVTSCVGPMLTYCAVDTLKYGINCSYSGYGCGFEADSGLPCVPEDGFVACTIPGSSRCANDKAWICDGLYESAFDCGSMGFACTSTQGATRCAPPSANCTPTDTTQCSGSSIDVCVGGLAKTFDCASIGLTCVPGAQGKSAHCG